MSKTNQKIKHRVPFGIPQAIPYTKATEKDIKKIELTLKKYARQLKKQGVDGDRIQQYLNSVIESYALSSINELEYSHLTHKKNILEAFTRRAADKSELQEQIDQITLQIAKTEEELEFVKRIYKENNPLYDGKLKMDGFQVGFEKDQEDSYDE